MVFAVVIGALFGFVAWLLTASQPAPAVLQRGAYDHILATLRNRLERGDLDQSEYNRIVRVLQAENRV